MAVILDAISIYKVVLMIQNVNPSFLCYLRGVLLWIHIYDYTHGTPAPELQEEKSTDQRQSFISAISKEL